MKAKLFTSIHVLVLALPVIAFSLLTLITFFLENQVLEFCEDIEIGMKQSNVLSKADNVFGTSRNTLSVGKDREFLGTNWFIYSSCVMEFKNGLLIHRWKNID